MRPDTSPEQDARSGKCGRARKEDRRESATAALRAGYLFLESDSYREALNSFKALLDGPELSAPERASLYCGMARCHLALGSHEEARRWTSEVDALSLPDEHRDLVAEAQVVLAQTETKSGRFDAALRAARKAYDILVEQPEGALLAEASKVLGTAHAELGDLVAARDCFIECLVCCRRLEDEEGVAGACNNLGILAKRSGDLSAAIDYFERALSIDESLGRTAAVARRLNNLGIALYRMSRWDEAEKHLCRSRDIFVSLGATRDIVSVESALGNLRRVRRDWQGARRYFESVLAKSREREYRRAEALALEFLGELENDLGDHEAALERLDAALECARRLSSDSDVIGEVLRRRAEVLMALGRLDEAESDCIEALRNCRSIGDRLEEGSALRVLGALSYARSSWTEARATMARSEAMLRTTGASFELAMTLLLDGIGLMRAEADGADSPDSAESRLFAALDLFRAVGADFWAARCAAEIARALHGSGDDARAGVWLDRARSELSRSACPSDRDDFETLAHAIAASDANGLRLKSDTYELIVKAAELLETDSGAARSLYAFASFLAAAVSSDRVVLFQYEDGVPIIQCAADRSGRRLAEVRRLVRARCAEGKRVPYVAGRSDSDPSGLPRHLGALALFPSTRPTRSPDGFLLYADRIRSEGVSPFDERELELLGAAAGLLGKVLERGDTVISSPDGVPSGVVTRDPGMLRILEHVHKLGGSDIPVLLLGESGVGKDVVARAIHGSGRRSGRFVALNASAIPPELQESELFGHVKGAFTDADRDREGLIEAASGGTLFLDEIGDMSPGLQVKLLRFLQSGEYRRVGESVIRSSDARVLSASNVDLRDEAMSGMFRRDLFYRLSTFVIEVPPLRERIGDIDPLMTHFLTMYSGLEGKAIEGFTDEVLELFRRYDWRGNNVRELENEVRRAVAFCEDGGTIGLEHIRPELAALWSETDGRHGCTGAGKATLKDEVEMLEKSRILEALSRCSSSKRAAAELLGLSRTGLYTKMRKYGIA
jgi:DNA-binding NtrC family response regulator/tetratricopeptide (TPR) repeat protein